MDKQMQILVVDDFPIMRQVIIQNLSAIGFMQITEAENGSEALALLRSSSFQFVITDWNMPDMSGIELLREIRLDEQLQKLPVLLATSEAKREMVIEAAKCGVNGYIVKPFTPQKFEQKIQKIFDSL